MTAIHKKPEHVTRRDLLGMAGKGVALGALGMSLAELIFAEKVYGQAATKTRMFDTVVCVFLQGGADHTSFWSSPTGNDTNRRGFVQPIMMGTDTKNNPWYGGDTLARTAAVVQNRANCDLFMMRSVTNGSNNHGYGQRRMTSFWNEGPLQDQYGSLGPVMNWFNTEFGRNGQLDISAIQVNGNNGNGMNDTRGIAGLQAALAIDADDNLANNPTVRTLAPSSSDADFERRAVFY